MLWPRNSTQYEWRARETKENPSTKRRAALAALSEKIRS